MEEKEKNELKVEFTDTKKNLSYTGSLGSLIGNSLNLIQMLYRSIKNKTNRRIFKNEITKFVTQGIVFMSNEDIEKALQNLKKEGETNE